MTAESGIERHAPPRITQDSDAKELPTSRPVASAASRGRSPELILVVDDDANVRESLGEVLNQEHYTVKLACHGREAVRQFLDAPPDLILLDVNMPDITGWQAFDILTQFDSSVPVMIITARPDLARRAADFGVNAFMEKPLDIPLLLQTVRQLLDDPHSRHFPPGLRIPPTNDLLGSQG